MLRLSRIAGVAVGAIAIVALASSCADQRATSPRVPVAPVAPASVVPLGGGPVIASAQLPSVRISEFHYDNPGTDVDEKVEISGPAGMSLDGWSLVLYNGTASTRAAYNTTSLTGLTVPATAGCGGRGVLVVSYPTNGIQNGSGTATGTDPDGMVLVNGSTVVDIISYEGSFVGASGVAAGLTFPDIGIRELGAAPEAAAAPVWSLKRSGADVWSGPSLNSFGVCNDNDEPPPSQEVDHVTVAPATATVTAGATRQFSAQAFDASNAVVSTATFVWSLDDHDPNAIVATVDATGLVTTFLPGDVTVTATTPNGKAGSAQLHIDPVAAAPSVRFSEIHYDNSGTDANEAIEIEGPAGTDLTGWSVVLYDGTGGASYNTRVLSETIVARPSCNGRGVVVLSYPTNGIQNGAPDGFALVDAAGTVVEFLSYEGTFTIDGRASVNIGVEESASTTSAQSLQRSEDGLSWAAPAASSFGRCNIEGPTPPPNGITFSGRLPTDAPLPVGFEDQLFATLRDGTTNAVIATTFTWTSETPAIATIDANGVMHALDAGTATFRATAAIDGSTATFSLPMSVASFSTTALYANNAEFGEPVGPADFIGHRPQYTFSFNRTRNTPNWVAYEIDPTHFNTDPSIVVDRCDCFTQDPTLPGDYTHLTTADYTGAGAFAGYGIDRGHLARSFDRTSAPGDNATTFYFSNIIPQAADLNQGPWANMENFLGDLVRNQGKEVYVIAGVAGAKPVTVKGEGKIVIPEKVWKVAVVMPHDRGLADVHSAADLEVIAVIAPNEPGVRNLDWNIWRTTVDEVEAVSGYDLLALLPDQIEIQVESNTRPPVPVADGPYTSAEGSPVSMSAAGSTDPDGDALSFSWNFGDGTSGTGVSPTHTYAQNGSYTVTLTVTDSHGLISAVTTSAAVSNVAPAIAPFAGATLLPRETFHASGSFTDPGSDPWSGTADFGDGAGPGTLLLSGKTFALSHTYQTPGTYTVTVGISDDLATSTRTGSVTVLTAAQGIQGITILVDDLFGGGGNSLNAKLQAAIKQLGADKPTPALNQLEAFLNELDALVGSGRVGSADVAPLRAEVDRVIRSVTH